MSNFKLNQAEVDRRAGYIEALNTAAGKIEHALGIYNRAVAQEWGIVEEAVADYNKVLEEARGFAVDIARQAEEDIDGKTDKWRDSERGEAAASWWDDWQNIDMDDFTIDQPDNIEFDQPSHADDLEALPTELEV